MKRAKVSFGFFALSVALLPAWALAIELHPQVGHTSAVEALSFSPDGEYFASGSADHTIRLWEISTGKEVRSFLGHTGTVSAVSFHPNGKYLASGSADHTIRLWEVSTGKEVRSFLGHTDEVGSLAFSKDGEYL